ncbi:MAG: GNAT family N-acetyltransferase [Anaerolineales bacterium]
MATFSFQPASEFSTPQLADLLTRGFEGYFVPINITPPVLLTMVRRDGIDLNESRVLLKDGEPIGVGLIARRGWTSRLAAMGIVSHARNGGAGTWAMQELMKEARLRGDQEMLLEVIEQNMAGVKLYQKVGFKIIRRLVGFKLEAPQAEASDELEEIDIREMARMISVFGSKDLPWQLSAESIAQHTPPSRAFRLGDAYCVISNPDVEHVSITSVLEKAEGGEAGQGQKLMRAVFFRFPNKVWHVTPIYPEELCPFFEKLGMQRESLSQWQMSATL